MTSTNGVGARIFVGDGPSGFAAGASTWVLSHRDGALVRFDGSRPKTLRRQPADDRRTPERMTRAGDSLWITGRGLDLVRVDPVTGDERGTTEIGAAGIDVAAVAGRLAVISATDDRRAAWRSDRRRGLVGRSGDGHGPSHERGDIGDVTDRRGGRGRQARRARRPARQAPDAYALTRAVASPT